MSPESSFAQKKSSDHLYSDYDYGLTSSKITGHLDTIFSGRRLALGPREEEGRIAAPLDPW